jgi:hypothetical protein
MNGEGLNGSQELSPEEARERATKLLESARSIKERLEATNTPEDRLVVEDNKVMRTVSTDRGQEEFEVIVSSDTLYVNKRLKPLEGSISWLQITHTEGHPGFNGTLTHHTEENSAGSNLLRLAPDDIQTTVRIVLGDVENTVASREQVTSQAQHAEVMDILGLPS